MSQRKLNLVLTLADGDMGALQNDFQRLGNHLDQPTFTAVLKQHCPAIASMFAAGNGDVVEHLFFHVDMNGDGHVSWDDLFDYAVGTANERLQRLPAEGIRPYSFSQYFARQDNVLHAAYYQEPDLMLLSSRHVPIQLVKPGTMEVVQMLRPDDVGGVGVLPVCTTYLGVSETLAAAFTDMRLRLWSAMDKEVPTPARPLSLDHMVTRLRAIPTVSPLCMMGCDSGGRLLTFEASRQAIAEPRLRSSIQLHSRSLGGTADFCLWRPIETRVVTCGYDRQLLWTDVTSDRTTLVGTSSCVLRRLEYFDAHQCILSVGHDNVLSAWVTHQSQKPCTRFDDPSRPHTETVIGLECVPNTPQVLTCDVGGMVKVWDIRNFRCAQTYQAVEGFNAEAESGLCKPLDDQEDIRTVVNSFCYLEGTRETCSIVSSGAYTHAYDRGAQPQLASQLPLNGVRYNPLGHTILSLSSTTIQQWDADVGHLLSEMPKSCKDDMSSFALDGVGRRMFLGTQGGDVEVRSCDGGSTLSTYKMHKGEVAAVEYSLAHRALMTIGTDGFLTVVVEGEAMSVPQRVKLSSRPLLSMCLSQDLSLLAVGASNGSTFVMDVLPPRSEDSELKHGGGVTETDVGVHCVTFMGSFPIVVTGHDNGDIMFWTVRPVKESRLLLSTNVKSVHRQEWAFGAGGHPGSVALGKMQRCESEAASASGVYSLSGSAPGGATSMKQYHRAAMNDKLLLSLLGRPLDSSCGLDDGGALATPADPKPTCLAFDPGTHHLFAATNKGYICVWKCCALLQGLEVPTCAYPSTPMFSMQARIDALQASSTAHQATLYPRTLAVVHAHKDEIVDLQVMAHIDVLASCGDDQRVLLFDLYGNRLAELSQGRLPTQELSMYEVPLEGIDSSDLVTQDTVAVLQAQTMLSSPRKPAAKDAPKAPGSSRTSRRPNVDRLLRGINEPPVSTDPHEYKAPDGQAVGSFDIQASSPQRNVGGAHATPASAMKRRKASLMSQSALSALLRANTDPIGSLCRHEIHAQLADLAEPLRLPRRAMGHRQQGGGGLHVVLPDEHKNGSIETPDAMAARPGDGVALDSPLVSGITGYSPANFSPGLRHQPSPQPTRPGRPVGPSTSPGLKSLVDDTRVFVATTRKRFVPRLKPLYPPLEASSAASNDRHLITLLRSLGDFSEDWLSQDARRRIAEAQAQRQREQEAAKQGEASVLTARVKGGPPRPPSAGVTAATCVPCGDAPSVDAAVPQATAEDVASCRSEEIHWGAEEDAKQQAAIDAACSADAVSRTAPSMAIPEQLEPDADLAPPSGLGDAQPSRRSIARPLSSHQNVRPPRHERLASVHQPHHAAVAPLGYDTRLTVPTTTGPLETLKLLHDAWSLAHHNGGTAQHYLGLTASGRDRARGDPARPESPPSGMRPLRSAGSARCASGGIRVGIAKLVKVAPIGTPAASDGPDFGPTPPSSPRQHARCLMLTNRSDQDGAPSSPARPQSQRNRPPQPSLLSPRGAPGAPSPATTRVGGGDAMSVGAGIHKIVTPRAQSGNVYTSHVRHGHVSLGKHTRVVRPAPRADAKSARIALLDEELKRCLLRLPPVADVQTIDHDVQRLQA